MKRRRNEQQPAIHVRAPTRKRRAIQGATQDKPQPRAKDGNVHLALDRNGRRTVSLERRTTGGITIENRAQRLASEAKLARLVGGVR